MCEVKNFFLFSKGLPVFCLNFPLQVGPRKLIFDRALHCKYNSLALARGLENCIFSIAPSVASRILLPLITPCLIRQDFKALRRFHILFLLIFLRAFRRSCTLPQKKILPTKSIYLFGKGK